MRHLTLAIPSVPVPTPADTLVPADMQAAQQALALILAGGTSRCESPPESGSAPMPLTEALLRLSEGEEVWLRIAYPEGPCRRRTLILQSLTDAENLLAS